MSYVVATPYRGPYALPIFDPAGKAVTKNTSDVDVLQGERMHDTAIITLRGENMTAPELQPGTPVQMSYGSTPTDVEVFYGYIDHINTHYDYRVQDGATLEDVVCLGLSYAMKDAFTGTWMKTQASSIVERIVTRYHLASLIQTDDFHWPQLSSTGASAWAYLVYLAEKTGYTLACNKDMLRFTSVDASMRQNWVGMPVFMTRNTAAMPTITRFASVQGEASQLGGNVKALRTVSGIDVNGNVIAAVNAGSSGSRLGTQSRYPFFTEQVSSQVVSSQVSAAATLAGMAEKNRFTHQATATLSGVTSVTQGVPIVISGIDALNDGMWWVHEVRHKIRSPGYTMDVLLGRDSMGDNGLRPIQSSSTAYSVNNPFAYALSNTPQTILVSQRWRAAHQFNVYVTGATS
jgi:phage protein D